MTNREWHPVTKANPCPACGKPDWCAFTAEGRLKCERTTEAPPGFVRLSVKDGGAVFKPDEGRRPHWHNPKPRRHAGDKTHKNAPRSGSFVAVANKATPFPTQAEAVAALVAKHGTPDHTWTYPNAAGEPVGMHLRWKLPPKVPGGKPRKLLLPVSRFADGWHHKAMPTPRPLYGLPDLLAADPGTVLYVTEGEKAADAARRLGLLATTSPGGCSGAMHADWSPVAGRHVVILPDHDDAGEKYAEAVTRACLTAGALSVRIVRLAALWDGMPHTGDMADLEAHELSTRGDLPTLRMELEAMTDKTEPETIEPAGGGSLDYTPFPVEVFPDPIRRLILEAGESMRCDGAFIGVPLLAMLAGAIGNTRRLRLKLGYEVPPILWTVIVSESGTIKSPAFRVAVRFTEKLEEALFAKHKEADQAAEADMMRYEIALAEWRKEAARAGGAAGDPPPKPERAKHERLTVKDTTVPALSVLLAENERGLILNRDELAGWLNGMNQYKGGKGDDAQHYLSFYDATSTVIDRKGGEPRSILLRSPALCITGNIQPGTMAKAMSDDHRESGMLARLLVAMPPRRSKVWTEAVLDSETLRQVGMVFEFLYTLKPATDDATGEPTPAMVTMSPEAKAIWADFYNQHNAEADAKHGDELAGWAKLEAYAARLALVMHKTRWACGDPTLADPMTLDATSIRAGIALAKWFGREMIRVYEVLAESPDARDRRRLAEWVERRGGTATARDLTRGPRHYRNKPREAAEALGELVAEGFGHWEADQNAGKPGRPAERRFKLGPPAAGDGDENS